ncbi:MAG: hypothetical protein ABIH34_00460 [Nanoarchaeota archaeon]
MGFLSSKEEVARRYYEKVTPHDKTLDHLATLGHETIAGMTPTQLREGMNYIRTVPLKDDKLRRIIRIAKARLEDYAQEQKREIGQESEKGEQKLGQTGQRNKGELKTSYDLAINRMAQKEQEEEQKLKAEERRIEQQVDTYFKMERRDQLAHLQKEEGQTDGFKRALAQRLKGQNPRDSLGKDHDGTTQFQGQPMTKEEKEAWMRRGKKAAKIAGYGVAAPFVGGYYAGKGAIKAGKKVADWHDRLDPILKILFWATVITQFIKFITFLRFGIDAAMAFAQFESSTFFIIFSFYILGADEDDFLKRFMVSLPAIIVWGVVFTVFAYGLNALLIPATVLGLAVIFFINYITIHPDPQDYLRRVMTMGGILGICLLNAGLLIRIGQWLFKILPPERAQNVLFIVYPEVKLANITGLYPFFFLLAILPVYLAKKIRTPGFQKAFALWAVLFISLVAIPIFADVSAVYNAMEKITGDDTYQSEFSDQVVEDASRSLYATRMMSCVIGALTFDPLKCEDLNKPPETEAQKRQTLEGMVKAGKMNVEVKIKTGAPRRVASLNLVPYTATLTASSQKKDVSLATSCGMLADENNDGDKFTIVDGTGIIEPETIMVSKFQETGTFETLSCKLFPHDLKKGQNKVLFKAELSNDVTTKLTQVFTSREAYTAEEKRALEDIAVLTEFYKRQTDAADDAEKSALAWLHFKTYPEEMHAFYPQGYFSVADPDFILPILISDRPVIILEKGMSFGLEGAINNKRDEGRIVEIKEGTLTIPSWLKLSDGCEYFTEREGGVYELKNPSSFNLLDLTPQDQVALFACQVKLRDEQDPSSIFENPHELHREDIVFTLDYTYEVNAIGYLNVGEIDLPEVYAGDVRTNGARGDINIQDMIIDVVKRSTALNRRGEKVPPALLLAYASVVNNGFIDDTRDGNGIGLMQLGPIALERCAKTPEELQEGGTNVECLIKMLVEDYNRYSSGHDPYDCGFSEYKGWYAAVAAQVDFSCRDKLFPGRVAAAQESFIPGVII